MNPIAEREVRSRWRGIKAFGLLLAYAASLALIVATTYNTAVAPTPAQFAQQIGQRIAHQGRDIFGALAVVQIIGWMLFAPTLTATTIAGERERGLLESLQLSPLTPGQIVRGKLASAMLFVLLMMFASLPVQAICFFMGGVSAFDFLQILALSLMTATTCASIGMLCSAWARRGGAALRSTFIVIVIWGIGSAIAGAISSAGGIFGFRFLGYYILHAFALTNPIVVVLSIIEAGKPAASLFPSSAFIPSGSPLDVLLSIPTWLYCLLFQGVAVLLMLKSAARAVRRPLSEQYWIVSRKLTAEAVPTASRQAQRRAPAPSMWWEIPFVSRLRFSNPVMMRESHGKFRMRHVPFWMVVVEILLGILVLGFYLTVFYWALFEPGSRTGIWWCLAFISLIIIMIATPMMGAGVFTREREAGTWEGLMLSRLSPRDILAGKIGAILLACLVLSIPIWPLLVLSINVYNSPDKNTVGVYTNGGVSPVQAVLTLGLIAATAWCYAAIGMTFSWLCKRTPVAAGWTLVTLFLVNILLPLFPVLVGPIASQFSSGIFKLVHPFYAMVELTDLEYAVTNYEEVVVASVASIAALTACGSVLLVYLHHAMRNRDREKDGKLRPTIAGGSPAK